MTVCQYWQRGQCRYGNACRFEHPGTSQPTAMAGGDITNTLVQTVKVDMEQWEKGSQWTFSCYSPAKETACYPGLDDVSPEEMRFEAYLARSNNTVDQFAKKVADMTAEYAGKRRALLVPTEQIKDTLRRIYCKESLVGIAPITAVAANTSVFGGSNARAGSSSGGIFQSKPSVFGSGSSMQQSAPNGGLFGSSSATNPFGSSGTSSVSVFGGSSAPSSSIFGGAPKPAAFGASGASSFGQTGSSILKPASTGGIFGNQLTSSSVFGSPNQTTVSNPFLSIQQQSQPASVFGQPPTCNVPTAVSSSSVFGGQPVFGSGTPAASLATSMATSSSVFGGSTSHSQTFGTAVEPSAFPSSTSVYGANAQTNQAVSPFGGARQIAASSIFGGVPSSTHSQQSVFGQQATSPSTSFGAPQQQQPSQTSSFGAPVAQISSGVFDDKASLALTSGNPFGTPATSSVPASTNLFGAPVSSTTATTGLFGKKIAEKVDSSAYSVDSVIAELERVQFMAPKFTLGLVPEIPPSKEMCV